jgi:hypothetical protein
LPDAALCTNVQFEENSHSALEQPSKRDIDQHIGNAAVAVRISAVGPFSVRKAGDITGTALFFGKS